MPLAFVLPWASGWALPPARSASFLSMFQYLRWVRQLLFTWCLLFGETSGGIYGRQREIRGIIYKSLLI